MHLQVYVPVKFLPLNNVQQCLIKQIRKEIPSFVNVFIADETFKDSFTLLLSISLFSQILSILLV